MSRKILSVLLAAFMVVGLASFMTKADVTGSFEIRVTIEPIECGSLPFVSITPTPTPPVNCEATLQKSDVETAININWTISGLTLGLHSHAGFTGLEDVILSLQAVLGALNISDEFIFAVPFGTDLLTITNPITAQVHKQKVFTKINPGDLLFYKKRVTASISIAGITLTNLAEFGDVNFPDPSKPQPPSYTAKDQNFAFGDALTLEGQTVSGITVRSITGICLDTQKKEKIKKHSFLGKLNPDCAGGRLVTNVTLSKVFADFVAGESIAEDFQADDIQTPPLRVVTKPIGPTITVGGSGPSAGSAVTIAPLGAPSGTIPANTTACTGNPDGRVDCTKSFLITNTGPLPVVVAVSTTFGGGLILSGASFVNLDCQPGGESFGFAGGAVFKLFPGEAKACGWLAHIFPGFTLFTDVAILQPEALNLAKALVNVEVVLTKEKKPGLFFDVEKIQILGIPIGPITADLFFEFHPNLLADPFSLETDLSFDTPLGAVSAVLTTTNITQQFFSSASLTLSSGGLTITQNFNSSLQLEETDVRLATTLNPDSNPASLKVSATICQLATCSAGGQGLVDLGVSLSVRRAGLTFTSISDLTGVNGVTLTSQSFRLSATAGAVNLGATITILPAWKGVFTAGVNF